MNGLFSRSKVNYGLKFPDSFVEPKVKLAGFTY